MGNIRTYRDLIAWQKAISLAKVVYQETSHFPSEERFGIVSQIRRAVVSVSSNIAEGHGRGQTRNYLRFLRMARGSLMETESLWVLAKELGFVSSERFGQAREAIAVDSMTHGH